VLTIGDQFPDSTFVRATEIAAFTLAPVAPLAGG
jgi:hypothetical protein